jgi:hypothetical protein
MRVLSVVTLVVSASVFAGEPQLQGTLKERLDASGYSYLRLETATGERWAAVPQVDLKTGSTVTVDVQAEMKDFESKTLKRTWPTIAFGTVPTARPTNPHEAGLPKTSPSTPPLDGTVVELINTTTYTYLRLTTSSGDVWAAVPLTKVANGAKARVLNPQPMDGFKSPTLNRTFEHIVFGTLALRD